MANASSKKVARAAKAGGSLRDRPKLGYPLALFVIVVLGTALVTYARSDRLTALSSKEAPVKDKDHWHAAYGIYVCDHFLAPLVDTKVDANGQKIDPDGIHTHGDGVMHVHPFSQRASGTGARLKIWAEQVGMKLGKDFIEVNGTRYANGYKCGDKDAKVYVYRWLDAFDEGVPAEVFDHDFGEIRYKADRMALTIAVVPDGTDVPRPDSIPQLNSLEDLPNPNDAASSGQDSTSSPISIDPNATISVPSSLPTGDSSTTVPGGAAPSSSEPPTTASAPPGTSR